MLLSLRLGCRLPLLFQLLPQIGAAHEQVREPPRDEEAHSPREYDPSEHPVRKGNAPEEMDELEVLDRPVVTMPIEVGHRVGKRARPGQQDDQRLTPPTGQDRIFFWLGSV